MNRSPSSEGACSTSEPDDEVLTGGGLPGWVSWLAAVACVAVAVGVLVSHLPSRHGPVRAEQRRHPAAPIVVARDVATGSDGSWVLQGDALFSVGGPQAAQRLSLAGLSLTTGTPRLALDVAAHRMWIVVTSAPISQMVEFDELTLRMLRDVTWPRLVRNAVAYHGHLYLQSESGVADLAPGAARPHPLAGLSGAVGSIAADPARHRLIAIDLGYPTNVWAFRPGHPPIHSSEPLDILGGSLAVVHGAIWVVGYTVAGRAVLHRLDPWTLQTARRADAQGFDPSAAIIGGGTHVLWVQTNRATASGPVACVDARTGRVEQEWRLPGVTAVVSSADGALAATPTGVLGLMMTDCRG